jgi:hypothetical protein
MNALTRSRASRLRHATMEMVVRYGNSQFNQGVAIAAVRPDDVDYWSRAATRQLGVVERLTIALVRVMAS